MGRTLHGVVYMEVDLYSNDAKQVAQKLPSLKITLDDRTLNIALIQLGSELQRAFGMAGQGNAAKKMLAEELHILDTQPWKVLDEVAIIHPHKTNLVSGSLYALRDKKEILTKKVEISYTADLNFLIDNENMIPFFTYIGKRGGSFKQPVWLLS